MALSEQGQAQEWAGGSGLLAFLSWPAHPLALTDPTS